MIFFHFLNIFQLSKLETIFLKVLLCSIWICQIHSIDHITCGCLFLALKSHLDSIFVMYCLYSNNLKNNEIIILSRSRLLSNIQFPPNYFNRTHELPKYLVFLFLLSCLLICFEKHSEIIWIASRVSTCY